MSASGGAAALAWRPLAPRATLNLGYTLTNGQCFGWKREAPAAATSNADAASSLSSSSSAAAAAAPAADEELFSGVVGDAIVLLRSRPASPHVEFAVPASLSEAEAAVEPALRDLFQLDCDPPLEALYGTWAAGDARMAAIAAALPGMRVLRQDPAECLVSFICSSNNHIARIGGMLARLRAAYGARIGSWGGADYHAFPALAALAGADEGALRGLGFGYRAKFVRTAAAQALDAGGEAWLAGLRGRQRPEVQGALCGLMGVGPKVADCVALFSLDQAGVVPVDTHVWAIAVRHYDDDAQLAGAKSLTPSVYERVGDALRRRFGPHAGWAHCLLFAAELPAFAPLLPPGMAEQLAAAREGERAARAAAKAAAKAVKEEEEEEAAGVEATSVGGGASSSGRKKKAAVAGKKATAADTSAAAAVATTSAARSDDSDDIGDDDLPPSQETLPSAPAAAVAPAEAAAAASSKRPRKQPADAGAGGKKARPQPEVEAVATT